MTSQVFDPEIVARYENETWSRCAAGYMDGFGALVGEAIAPLLDEVAVSKGRRVLDLGTGPGPAAAAAADRGAHAIGVDFSEAMLAEARSLHPKIEFQMGSAEALPFPDADFDAVVGNFMLHHCGAPSAVLEEVFRVLRKGGRAGFTIWADPAKLQAFGLFFAAVEEHAGAAELPHGPLFGVSDFQFFHQLMRGAGFRDSSVREIPIAWRMKSIDPLLAAFRDWANLETLPKDVQAAIDASVRKCSEAYRSGKGFVVPNPAILISATK